MSTRTVERQELYDFQCDDMHVGVKRFNGVSRNSLIQRSKKSETMPTYYHILFSCFDIFS